MIDQTKASRLRGRGGAGFPSGIKLETVSRAQSADGRKFVVVNCDEGDAGSYIDKELMERDPHTQLEGALLAAYSCGAQEVILYIRFEYPRLLRVMRQAIADAEGAGLIVRIFWEAISPAGYGSSRSGGVHLRRGDLTAQVHRRGPGHRQLQAALPRREGALRLPHGGEQRRDPAQPALDH